MSKITSVAKQLIDLLYLIPGYTDECGEVVVRISQNKGGASNASVTYITRESEELHGGELARVIEKRVNIANPAILCCKNSKSGLQ